MTVKNKRFVAEIEGLHDIMTGNFVLYTEEALADINSWLYPYAKPVILHHKDEDGKIIGRVLEVKKVPSKIKSGLNALWIKAQINDLEAIEGIKNKTFLTTSIGADGTDVECSICGHKISSGVACAHKRGRTYKNKLCYWIVKKLNAKEISFVIVPSDKYAQVLNYYEEDIPKDEKDEIKAPLEDLKTSSKKETFMTLEEALEKIKALEEDIEKHSTALQEAKENLTSEIVLREGLENELGEVRLKEKQTKINDILALREQLGMRKLETEAFASKSDVALAEMYEDLEAELSFKESLKAPELIIQTEPETKPEPEIIAPIQIQESKNTTLETELETVEKSYARSAKDHLSHLLG